MNRGVAHMDRSSPVVNKASKQKKGASATMIIKGEEPPKEKKKIPVERKTKCRGKETIQQG